MKAHGKRHRSPLVFPPSDTQGTGASLEPSSALVGGQSREVGSEMKGMADIADTPQALAQLAPTNTLTHYGGAAFRGLKRAAGI